MSAATWLDDNNRYLAAALQWLRLRLIQLAPEGPSVTTGVSASGTTETAAPQFLQRFLGGNPPAVKEVPRLTQSPRLSLAEQLEAAATERAAAAQAEPPPALILLAQRLGLSDFERDTLLLCAAMELDPDMAGLCSRVPGNAGRSYPTFALALSAFDQPSWDALAAQRPLRYARLLEINQPGATPLTASALRADERIVNFIKGLNLLDDRLSTLVTPVAASDGLPLAESQQQVVETVLQRLQLANVQAALPVVQLVGVDGDSKLAVAQQACVVLNRHLYRIALDALPNQPAEIETLARLWERESVLLPVALYIDAENVDASHTDASKALLRLLAHGLGLVFLAVRETPLQLSCASFPVDVNRPTASEQREAWRSALSTQAVDADAIAQSLAGQFNFNLHDLHAVAASALQAVEPEHDLRDRVWDACRDLTRPRLDQLAQRLDPKATWEDLVLPDESAKLLRQVAAQVRERHKVYADWGFALKMNRGMGISALFCGESGTGKTMAAEVIANELRMNLYRIDLSAVVSKYIGETEKNLRKLFDAAEQGGAILFFDEADALFGKRSEVKDSHDRYANIEINYLLQRMESFSGLAILATNMKSALDPAFMRRLRFIVNFQFPGVQERKLIWEKALPPQTPKEVLDYERLAKLNITGAHITSIALNAAFLAAKYETAVTMPLMLEAARSELRKLDKPINEAEFRVMAAVRNAP